MDCGLPVSSVHGILHARILEWVAIPFSRGSSQPRDKIQVSLIAGGFFTVWATRIKEDPLKEEMTSHSSILVWKILLTEKPGGLQSMGPQRVGQDMMGYP